LKTSDTIKPAGEKSPKVSENLPYIYSSYTDYNKIAGVKIPESQYSCDRSIIKGYNAAALP
jgi:hypothetical protein